MGHRQSERLARERVRMMPVVRSRASDRFRAHIARAVASRRIFPYLAGTTAALAVIVGVLVRTIAPKDFDSVGEGIWWAIVTLATVGYGDVVPTSPWGRVIGGVVIVLGVTFLAFLTATITSMFVATEQREEAARLTALQATKDEETRALLRRLDERLAVIEATLDRRAAD
jgi:voltage-gated potassium channel